jgi:3-mercaptopyruvate sulfurtransferase SseA
MEIPRLTVQEVTERVARGERIAFVDARSPKAYGSATQHIPGSVRVPPGDVDRHAAVVSRQAAAVVAYCTRPSEASSARVALRLRQLGVPRAFALTGGFDAWRGAGLPVEPLRRPETEPNTSDHQIL